MPAVIVCCADMHDDKKLCKTKNKTQQKQNTAKTLTPFCARLFAAARALVAWLASGARHPTRQKSYDVA